MTIFECDDGRGGTTRLVLDWIVAVDVHWTGDSWGIYAQPLMGDSILVRRMLGYSSFGGDPDYAEKDQRVKAHAAAFAVELMDRVAALPAPTFTRA